MIAIGAREVVTAGTRRPIPAFKVDMTFSGITTTSWITDTGEIVREESPMGLITVLETQEQAMALGVSNRDAGRHARERRRSCRAWRRRTASSSRAT